MTAQFTLLPLGTKSDSLSKILAKAMRHVVDSGLDYKVGPMGTAVEGDWYEIMNLVNRCRKTLLRECDRVEIVLTIDDRKGVQNALAGKVRSLEKRLGSKLKK